MRRYLGAAAALFALLVLAGSASAHEFDHPAPAFAPTAPPHDTPLESPAGAWELVASIPTGNPHTDLDFFTQRKPGRFPGTFVNEIYASVGTLAAGANGAGQTIVQLTRNGVVGPLTPRFVAGFPSAECPSNPRAALGLQHDVEATPKGNVIFNTAFPLGVRADTRDAQLIIDATDQAGRCHDNGPFPQGVPGNRGGLEIIDITKLGPNADNCPLRQQSLNVEDRCAVELHLTSHIGEAHTVNVDPKRPHIAFAVTSDTVPVTCNPDDTDCDRRDEDADPNTRQGLALDGFELVDLRSCMNFSPLASVAFKRMVCRPKVYRYRWPTALMSVGHTSDGGGSGGCHELEIYPDDTLTCAAINTTMHFDLSGAFNDNGTPSNYLDDSPRGTPLPCRVRPSSSTVTWPTGAMVTDCVDTDPNTPGNELDIEGWKAIGAPSLAGVRHIGTAFHQGRGGPYPATDDVDVSHEAEKTQSRRFILMSDERGGGVLPPAATCAGAPGTPGDPVGNGGIQAFRVDRLLPVTPPGVDPSPSAAEAAWTSYARTPTGAKAIYRAPIVIPEATFCTAHVFQIIPGQNRIFMGWYTQGTQVVDFIEREDGTIEFRKAGHFVPPLASTWVSHVFKMQQNADGTFTYWGATGDFGRQAIDIWRVTLDAPQRPLAPAPDQNPPPEDPAVAFTKTGPTSATRGSTITYTLSYTNAGPAPAENAKIVDKLPSGLTFVSASNGATYNSWTRTVTWKLGTVPVGASGSVTLTARVSPYARSGSTITNTATFSA
ncbi:MAG: DUF11 domain-containing protein, partial [Actinomycetota bacterium]|nr:DUF11 domain-containing protein [Actinomycetota bacterium]